jgi:hypothetical protein
VSYCACQIEPSVSYWFQFCQHALQGQKRRPCCACALLASCMPCTASTLSAARDGCFDAPAARPSRSAIPVVAAVLAIFVEGKKPSLAEFLALCVLTSGVMLAVWEGTSRGSSYGILLCFAGMISNSAMMTFSGRVLSEKCGARGSILQCRSDQWLPNRDQMSYSACQIGPSVSYWFQ